jgi:hypothetical protein
MGMEMERKEEEFEETKRIIRTVNRRTDNTMAKKRTKGQTTIYKTLHLELKIE